MICQGALDGSGAQMIKERWQCYAVVASIMLAIFVAYLIERDCQRDLAFQRSFPAPLSEVIVGSEPIKCWFDK
jgi:hypothetical protein